MTDTIVSFAVNKLGEFLIQEIVLRQDSRTKVEWLKNEMGYMQSFLQDAEEKLSNDHRVQQWISEITEVAPDTVAILDDFTLRLGGGAPKSGGFVDSFQMCACICRREANLYNIGKEIESLKQRVLDISRKRETYGIRNLSNAAEGPSSGPNNNKSMAKILRRAASFADEGQLFVGFEDVTKTLLVELLKYEPRRSVISIYGMGGLGKTTVARKLYHSSRVMETFPYRAWVCVSQEYSTSDLLRTLIKSFAKVCCKEEEQEMIEKMDKKVSLLEKVEKMNQDDLEHYLHDILKNCRYLVVVDDVWHKEAWYSLKRAFPQNNFGSRVIITTRKRDVATRVDDRTFVHELRFFTPDESWELFSKKISHGDGYSHCSSAGMMDLGREMIQKCRGLPLAIVVLGGLLCQKKSLREWQKVKDHIWRHLKNDSLEISFLLSLSYNDLSSELKQCFLYFGIFPEDSVINVEKLMLLWMAEELITSKDERMEDVAYHHLRELIDRSLVQAVDKHNWNIKIFQCRIHDLLRDLAVQKAKEVNFFDIYDPRVYSTLPSRRRQAVHLQIDKYFSLGISNLKLRSLLFFNPDSENPKLKNLYSLCRNVRYLYVLDLESVKFRSSSGKLPSVIGNLIHLRFLGISNTNFGIVPRSLGKLKNLQTLYAVSLVLVLPREVCQLTNLRHLITSYEGHLNIGALSNLRTLKCVKYDHWLEIDTTNLRDLQELAIGKIKMPLKKAHSLESIGKLNSLTTLCLMCTSLGQFPPFDPLSSCPNLLRLWLVGKIQSLGQLKKLPQSIMMLTLENSELKKDPMGVLESFPNLRSLELSRAYEGNTIACNANGFPELEFLRLRCMINLESWQLAEGAMPMIRRFGTFKCPRLIVPERIRHISVFGETEERDLLYQRQWM